MTELWKNKVFYEKNKNKNRKNNKNNFRFVTFWFGTLPVFLTTINSPASFAIVSRPYR